jgi:hypothetical protein
MRRPRQIRLRKTWHAFVPVAVATVVISGMSWAPPLLTPAVAQASTGSGGEFVPVQGRILDTRSGSSIGGYTTQMPANTWRSVQVTGLVGVPTTGVAAVAVNFTALNDASAGHLNADKDEATPNTTGTFLFWNGDGASTNSGVVAVGTDGKIQVKATTATDLVIDVQGYYTAGDPAAGGFVPLPESRLVDTRNGTGLPEAPIVEDTTTTVQVGGLAGVPSDASAVMLNFLVLNQTASGSVIPYPADQTKPTQKLAFDPSDSDSTTSAVGLSAGSAPGAIKINIEMNGSGGTLDLVVDVLGYFTASRLGGAFTPAAARVYDSRNTGNSPLAAGATRTIQVSGVSGVPTSGIGAAAMNVEIFDGNGVSGGWTHVWPDDAVEPNPSMAVEYDAGGAASNLMTVALGADGGVKVHNLGSDQVDFALDVEGWYAPATVATSRSYFESDSATILDTADGTGGYSSPMQANVWRAVQVAGVEGIPSSVTAVEVNMSFTNAATGGQLYAASSVGDESTGSAAAIYQAGSQNDSSDMVVSVGPSGQIEISTTSATDVALTVDGAYSAGDVDHGGNFFGIEPIVLASSTANTGGLKGPIASGTSADVPIAGVGGVLANASAVMLRVDGQNMGTQNSVLTVAPADEPTMVSTLALPSGSTRIWTLPVPLTSAGKLRVAVTNGSAVNLGVTAVGYFLSPSDGNDLVPVEEQLYGPKSGNAVAVPANGSAIVNVAGVGNVPPAGDISAVVANLSLASVVAGSGNVTLGPDPADAGGTAETPISLNYSTSTSASAVATVRIPYDGNLLLTNSGGASISVELDLEGWYTLGNNEDVNPDMTFSDSDPDPGPSVDPSLEASDNPDTDALNDPANLTSTVVDTPNTLADVPDDSSAKPAADFAQSESDAATSEADADDATPQFSFDQATSSTFNARSDPQADCATSNAETTCYLPVSMTDTEWSDETADYQDVPIDSSVTNTATATAYDGMGIPDDGSTVSADKVSVPKRCFTKVAGTAVVISRFEVCFHSAGVLEHYSGDSNWPDGSVLITFVKLDESNPKGSTATTTWWMRFGAGAGVYGNTIDRQISLLCNTSAGVNDNCGSHTQSGWSTFDTRINDPAPHKQVAITRWTTDVGAPTSGTTISSDTSMTAKFTPASHNVITKHKYAGGKKIDVRRTDHMSNVGTVFPVVTPIFTKLNTSSGSRTEESAKFVLRAQKNIPNHVGSFDYILSGAPPLTRTTNTTWKKNNRKAACRSFHRHNKEDSCDEYPFASTRQGAWKHPPPESERDHVRLSDNRIAGSFLGGFYRRQRVIDGDDFYVEVQ